MRSHASCRALSMRLRFLRQTSLRRFNDWLSADAIYGGRSAGRIVRHQANRLLVASIDRQALLTESWSPSGCCTVRRRGSRSGRRITLQEDGKLLSDGHSPLAGGAAATSHWCVAPTGVVHSWLRRLQGGYFSSCRPSPAGTSVPGAAERTYGP